MSASVSYAVHLFTQELKQNWWYCYFILDDGIHKIIHKTTAREKKGFRFKTL